MSPPHAKQWEGAQDKACPKCATMMFQLLDETAAVMDSMPPVWQLEWRCKACGHTEPAGTLCSDNDQPIIRLLREAYTLAQIPPKIPREIPDLPDRE